jgi:glycosyltransferase involved in cell wall biosynthesis
MKVIVVRSRAIDPGAMKIAEALHEDGHDVAVLLWDRTGTFVETAQDGPNVSTLRAPAPYDRLSAILLMPLWWAYEFLFLLRSRADVVHACDLDTLLPAIASKLVLRNKLCYTIFDFYAANIPRAVPNRLRRLVATLERAGLQSVDVLFLPDECRYEQVAGARIKKLVYVYNSPPDNSNMPVEPSPHERGDTVLFYAGLLHESRGLRVVIEAVTDVERTTFIVAGSGPDQVFVEEVEARLPGKVQYMGQIPYRRVLEETSRADILIALYDPNVPNSRFASPNKLFEAMMCAKPIIISEGAAASSIVRDEDCGIVVSYADREAIRDAIQQLVSDSTLRERLGFNGRRAYEERYSWAIMRRRLRAAYESFGL